MTKPSERSKHLEREPFILPVRGLDGLWHCPLCNHIEPSAVQLAGHILATREYHDMLKPWASMVLNERFPSDKRLHEINENLSNSR